MPSKLDCVNKKVENILIISEKNLLPSGFFDLPYNFFSLSNLKSKLKDKIKNISFVDEVNFDIDLRVDVIVCDSGNLIKDAYTSSKNIGCRIIYMSGLGDNVNLPPDVIVVKLSNKSFTKGGVIIYPTNIYPEEIPKSKKFNTCFSLSKNVPKELMASDKMSLNDCSVYLNLEPKVLDYEAIHAMGCGTLVISTNNDFCDKFLSFSNAIICNSPQEALNKAKFYLDNPKESQIIRVNALRSYRERFSKTIFESRWNSLLGDC